MRDQSRTRETEYQHRGIHRPRAAKIGDELPKASRAACGNRLQRGLLQQLRYYVARRAPTDLREASPKNVLRMIRRAVSNATPERLGITRQRRHLAKHACPSLGICERPRLDALDGQRKHRRHLVSLRVRLREAPLDRCSTTAAIVIAHHNPCLRLPGCELAADPGLVALTTNPGFVSEINPA